ncbi:MAG: hypothetical protein WCP28_07570 [Actinomycetes bacterium]
MADIEVGDGAVEVKLTFSEKAGGVHGDFTFPIASIVNVTADADPITAVRGLKAPGTGLPNRKIGTWRADGKKDYVNVKRGEAGLVIALTGQDFDRIILTLPDPDGALAQLIAAGAAHAAKTARPTEGTETTDPTGSPDSDGATPQLS